MHLNRSRYDPVCGWKLSSVILVPFPFSDLSASKLRPALVLAAAGRDDWVCLQITSRPYADSNAIELAPTDFATGSLQRVSFVRPGKLFTAHQTLFQRVVAQIGEEKLAEVRSVVIDLVRTGKLAG